MKLADLPTAKALQELGYDGEISAWIDKDDGIVERDAAFLYDWHIPCPRLDDAAYWLRERHGLFVHITYVPNCRLYFPHISDNIAHYESNYYGASASPDYDTALENGVKQIIKIIKAEKK